MIDQNLLLLDKPALQWHNTEELMKERSLYGHLYIEGKLMMTFLHRLAALFCTADAISYARKAAHKQGAQVVAVIMY